MKKFLCLRIAKPLCIPKDTGLSTVPDPSALPSWLSEEDVNYYASKFNQKGFTGPVNYYRCSDLYVPKTYTMAIIIKELVINLLSGQIGD